MTTRTADETIKAPSEMNDGEAHWFLCHSDGSRCEDGCDKAALPEPLKFYTEQTPLVVVDMRTYDVWARAQGWTDVRKCACRTLGCGDSHRSGCVNDPYISRMP